MSGQVFWCRADDNGVMNVPVTAKADREGLRRRIEGLRSLSTIPVVLQKILEVVDDDGSSIEDLEEVLKRDQALVARIVAISNAAFYGQSRSVESISQAILILGFNMVKCLAVSVSILGSVGSSHHLFDIKRLWLHSFKVANVSVVIADKCNVVGRETAFLAGLLHDIGRAILFQLFGEEYLVVSLQGREGLQEREESAFGAGHSLVGAWFAERYLMPAGCVAAIQFHHEPNSLELADSESLNALKPLITAVHFADSIASGEKGDELIDDFAPIEDYSEVLHTLGLEESAVEEIREALAEKEASMTAFYNIAGGDG